jgi:hypothetical protein
MKHKNIILSSLALMVFSITARSAYYSIDLNITKKTEVVSDLNAKKDTKSHQTVTKDDGIGDMNDSDNFEKRFVYFDRLLAEDDNFELVKKVIKDAKKLGFNGIVISQEYIYTRLTHSNALIDKIKNYMSQIEILAHENGLEIIPMHFRVKVANTVVQDGDKSNPFYKDGKFSFSEANRVETLYEVNGSVAKVIAKPQVKTSKNILENLYLYDNIKPNTHYKITLDADTNGFKNGEIKVSVLDGGYNGENGKVIFGVNKYFTNVVPTKKNGKYEIYFNSLDHDSLNNSIKVYIGDYPEVSVNSVTLQEVGYTKNIHVVRTENIVEVKSQTDGKVYENNIDYTIDDNGINILSAQMQQEKLLLVTWYPEVSTSLPADQVTFTDICADEKLYYEIMLDQLQNIKSVYNDRVDSLAFEDDEWRTAGWDDKCSKLYEKEFSKMGNGKFTGGDYIGISTKRMVEKFLTDLNKTDAKVYLMSDMFDPNFNGKNPYMGVRGGAIDAAKYLPKDKVAMFNWFPNPYEPGLEDKKEDDFLKSAKYFADLGLKQVIAGYHDDMRNLDSNIAFYKKSDKKTQESIIGFMYLIWFQPNKPATYDDMDDVVKRICTELPGKWPSDVCREVIK